MLVETAPNAIEASDEEREGYLFLLNQLERLHRLKLDVVRDELFRLKISDVSPAQGVILFAIGDDMVTPNELAARGQYQGTNITYNLNALVKAGHVARRTCEFDRRSKRLWLTDSGKEIAAIVGALFARHAAEFSAREGRECVERSHATLNIIERFLKSQR